MKKGKKFEDGKDPIADIIEVGDKVFEAWEGGDVVILETEPESKPEAQTENESKNSKIAFVEATVEPAVRYEVDENVEVILKSDETIITEEKVTKIIENWIKKQGLKKCIVVAFELPTEYKNCKTKIEKNGKEVKEIRVLSNNTAQFRTLRKKFYTVLHKYAWNSPLGWILRSDVDVKELSPIIDELNKLAKTQRVVELIECYLPVKSMVEWLDSWIKKVKLDAKYFYEKLKEVEEGSKEAKRLKKRYEELEAELEALEKELEALRSLGYA